MFLHTHTHLPNHTHQDYKLDNTFDEDIDFHALPVRTKTVTLQRLCDFRLDTVDVSDIVDGFEVDSLRVTSVGRDSRGSIYWYFYGTRLYREDPPIRQRRPNDPTEPEPPVWQVVCFTLDDWLALAARFDGSRNVAERTLLQTLRDDFMPDIPKLFRRKELLRRRK